MAEMEEWEYDGAAYAPEEDIDEVNEIDPDDVLMGVYIPTLESRGNEGIGSLFECLCMVKVITILIIEQMISLR